MVIKRNLLLSKKQFNGFLEIDGFDFETIILENYEWMKKEIAEANFLFKQPIGYVIIYNPFLKKVFVYQRSKKDEDYSEKRLQGKYSCGVGGHIEKIDLATTNPIYASILREVSEEVEINGSQNLKIIGYINDNDEVGNVHFGILYLMETDAKIILPNSPEIENGKLVDMVEFEQICTNLDLDVESWTKIALVPLKKKIAKNY